MKFSHKTLKQTSKFKLSSGFTVVEVALAAAIYVIVSLGLVSITLQGIQNNRLAQEQTFATQFASEGIEAVRSIKQRGFTNLVNSASTGVETSGGNWIFSGANNQVDKYTRVISVSDVNRDSSGNIVTAPSGTLDPQTKKVVSTVTWNVTPARQNSVTLNQYLTNWKKTGILVYGNGGTTTDSMQYKIFNPDKDIWSTPASVADVDGGSSNRAPRVVRLYSSPTRIEKILISRHFDGVSQYIYAQVYNGSTWGNVQLLSSWISILFLDVQNFDGTYMDNDNFMVVYSDNTNIPKMRIWNGSSWSSQSSLTSLGAADQIPSYLVAKARPGTNEVMAAFISLGSSRMTSTQYYDGSTWSAFTSHSFNAPVGTKKYMDFDWSPNNPLIGGLILSNSTNDRAQHIKIWTANGSGGGAWSAIANSANQGAGATRIGSMKIVGRPGANVFESCNNNTQSDIICYQSSFTPAFSNPTNQTIETNTPGGSGLDFDLAFETLSGDPAIITYTDNSSTPKFKKFTASSTTWDASATSISTTGSPGVLRTAKTIPNPYSDDMIVLMGDANLDLATIFWDGQNNSMYSSPAGRAYTTHGTNGSALEEYWYDFSWDY